MTLRDLQGRVFKLGEVRYVIARHQPETQRVRCYRMEGKLVSIAKLPLSFVLEQVTDKTTLEELA
ncbi:MAG TPA: hypothetical protein VL379_05175 [Pseudomonadales bacterium]|jgi:hypothetical protein|nr:hypothetical protein [Pseudomonadales bacterium]